jgi:hypothetical protein
LNREAGGNAFVLAICIGSIPIARSRNADDSIAFTSGKH